MPFWTLGYPHHRPYPEFQGYEFNSPTYQPDYPSHPASIPSHPYQTYSSEVGDFFPTWSDKDWQPQNAHYHQDQTCPDQLQNQPPPQQSFEPTAEEDHYANSTAGEIDGATGFQQNVESCEAETVMNMQYTCEEQQSSMDVMIRQVALLAEMLKDIRENEARFEADGNNEEEDNIRNVGEEGPANVEKESEALLKEAGTGEIESDEEGILIEEESITTPPEDKALQKISVEANDEPRKREEDVILHGVKLNNTLFYLQAEGVHVPSEKVDEFTTLMRKRKETRRETISEAQRV